MHSPPMQAASCGHRRLVLRGGAGASPAKFWRSQARCCAACEPSVCAREGDGSERCRCRPTGKHCKRTDAKHSARAFVATALPGGVCSCGRCTTSCLQECICCHSPARSEYLCLPGGAAGAMSTCKYGQKYCPCVCVCMCVAQEWEGKAGEEGRGRERKGKGGKGRRRDGDRVRDRQREGRAEGGTGREEAGRKRRREIEREERRKRRD